MKKEYLFLIGAGALAYYFYNKSKKPDLTTDQQKGILKDTFGKYLPQTTGTAKKKLKPVIEALPLQNITKQQFEANKPKLLQKGVTLIKKLISKKKVAGFNDCIGLY